MGARVQRNSPEWNAMWNAIRELEGGDGPGFRAWQYMSTEDGPNGEVHQFRCKYHPTRCRGSDCVDIPDSGLSRETMPSGAVDCPRLGDGATAPPVTEAVAPMTSFETPSREDDVAVWREIVATMDDDPLISRAALTANERSSLWDAINRYVVACGGEPSKHVHGNVERMDAVVAVERIVAAAIVSAQC